MSSSLGIVMLAPFPKRKQERMSPQVPSEEAYWFITLVIIYLAPDTKEQFTVYKELFKYITSLNFYNTPMR